EHSSEMCPELHLFIKIMRPETKAEFVIGTLLLIISAACGVMAKLKITTNTVALSLIGSCGVLVSIYFGIRHLKRSKPFVREVRKSDWVVAHLNSHRGVSVRIPSAVHKRGKHPKVEFQRGGSVYGSNDL